MHALRLLAKGVALHDKPDESYRADVQRSPQEVPVMPCGSAFCWRSAPHSVWHG